MKPYQKKITRQPIKGRTHKAWTDEDRNKLRVMYEQGTSYGEMAGYLGRTVGSVAGAVHIMKKRDEEEKFIHVLAKDIREVEAMNKKVNAQLSAVNPVLTSKEQDAKLRSFTLYDGIYDEAEPDEDRSLWQRIFGAIKRVMRRA